jgi:hypothetical protein
MLWQVQIDHAGAICSRPIPARPAAPAAPAFHPLVVHDDEIDRHLTWASSGDPNHLLTEEQPRQLLQSFVGVCDALRAATGREPQFDSPRDIRHEIVWELTPDQRSKHKLLGGMGGRPGTGVLVLTNNRAQPVRQPVADRVPPEMEAVDLDYPSRSGLQEQLRTEGFRLHWVREEQTARRRQQGWDIVTVERDGRRVGFKVPPGMPSVDPSALLLMKRREPDKT